MSEQTPATVPDANTAPDATTVMDTPEPVTRKVWDGTPESALEIRRWMLTSSAMRADARLVTEVTPEQALERLDSAGVEVETAPAHLFVDQPGAEPQRVDVGQAVVRNADGSFSVD
jgi:hypothetical protein